VSLYWRPLLEDYGSDTRGMKEKARVNFLREKL